MLRPERKQGLSADPFYGKARCSPMLGDLKDLKQHQVPASR